MPRGAWWKKKAQQAGRSQPQKRTGRIREIIELKERRPRDRGGATLGSLKRTVLGILGLEPVIGNVRVPDTDFSI